MQSTLTREGFYWDSSDIKSPRSTLEKYLIGTAPQAILGVFFAYLFENDIFLTGDKTCQH
jgi:hypothetical protein